MAVLGSTIASPADRSDEAETQAGVTHHLRCLDGWRGLCILLVLLGHFVGPLGTLGNIGVEFFFVLSGRLMADILVIQRQPIFTFLKRRASRVLPTLWFYGGLIGAAVIMTDQLGGSAVRWPSSLGSMFLFHNYIWGPATIPFLQHTWSLAVEEHSYLLLVAVILFARRRAGPAAIVALLVATLAVLNGMVLLDHQIDGAQNIFWRSDVRAASVLVSFATFLIVRRFHTLIPHRTILAPLCALGAFLCLAFDGNLDSVHLTGCSLLAAIAVNLIEDSAPPVLALFQSSLLGWLGTLSFSLYIWQQPFFLSMGGGLPLLVALPLTFACAFWSYTRVERPARDWLNRHWTGRMVELGKTVATPHQGRSLLAPQSSTPSG